MKGKTLRIEPSVLPERNNLPGIEYCCRIKSEVKLFLL